LIDGEPVVLGVSVSNSLQDSSDTAAAEEARTQERADVQLPTDLQPSDSVEGHLTAGAGQTPATSALPEKIFMAAVSVLPRPFHRDCDATCHEQCAEDDDGLGTWAAALHDVADNKKATVLVGLDISAASDTIAAVPDRLRCWRVAITYSCTRTAPIGSST